MLRLIRETEAGPTVTSSVVLGMVLVGDALLYAILPIHAETFGVSLLWVGVLLSINRFVRLFLYGSIAHLGAIWGLRRLMVSGAALGAASTLVVAVGSGEPVLLLARIAWGAAFAALSVSVLAYATYNQSGAAGRVGWSFSIRHMGPLLALTGGAWLAGTGGPRVALLVLGAVSLLAVPLARRLPNPPFTRPTGASGWWPGRPGRVDAVKFGVALAVDGMFVAMVGLLFQARMETETAVLAAGLVLAGKHLGVVVLSPVGGMVAERMGSARTGFWAILLLAAGMGLLAMDRLFIGIVLVLAAQPVLLTVLPILAVEASPKPALSALASLNAWRDLGAAIGPLVALPLYQWTGALPLFTSATLLVLILSFWVSSRRGGTRKNAINPRKTT